MDTGHEQAPTFAAEGWAKATREVGVAAVTAGPGVTNAMGALGSAQMGNSPVLVLAGRAPAARWGAGSLQEINHIPFVRPLTKLAQTAQSTPEIPGLVDEAIATALAPHSGPVFIDVPMDRLFAEAEDPDTDVILREGEGGPMADGDELERAIALLRQAERPVVMAGTNLYWAHAETALLELVSELRIPVFLNGMARGCVPADHELAFSRARAEGLQEADVALVIGVPIDFRLAFGAAFGAETELIVVDRAEAVREHPRPVAAELVGSIAGSLRALRGGVCGRGQDTTDWMAHLRAIETRKRAAESAELSDGRSPLHPMRLYKELAEVVDRDAIIIGDGGDFVSYAGRVIDRYEPGCWMDPGPFGCLGSGPPYTLAAKLARPDRQVVLLLGDGAFGFGFGGW